jgi:hypothetical protein
MPKKTSKFKDGNKTTTITIEDWPPPLQDQTDSGSEVQGYMAQDAAPQSEISFEIIDGNKRLTITIAE